MTDRLVSNPLSFFSGRDGLTKRQRERQRSETSTDPTLLGVIQYLDKMWLVCRSPFIAKIIKMKFDNDLHCCWFTDKINSTMKKLLLTVLSRFYMQNTWFLSPSVVSEGVKWLFGYIFHWNIMPNLSNLVFFKPKMTNKIHLKTKKYTVCLSQIDCFGAHLL